MLRKTGMFSLLSATLLGIVSLPAQANNATVQTSTQQAVINGNNNQVIQVINQTNVINHSGRGNQRRNDERNNRATVQDAYQGVSVHGSNNRVRQESNQVNAEQSSRGRRRPIDLEAREQEDWDDNESREREHRDDD
ncbi:MAG: hypothetical protein MJA27_08505 [Pseudanabaenales cyanobacterium]|nr:hypothetical protein [Pseudanabaenales cyanobacterium]